jgi:uncharacterized protein (TIGR03083 family)
MPRPLRQYYSDEPARIVVDPDLGSVVAPWVRHRQRLVDGIGSLTADQWRAQSRCEGWTVRDVMCHLLDVDPFWVLSLTSGQAGSPTTFLKGFDPKAMPAELVDAKAELTTTDVARRFEENTSTFVDAVTSIDGDDWSATAESPLGHVPAWLMLAHAMWDSWLHEYDVFEPLDLAAPVDLDELAVVTWYTLVFGATQGGLLQDDRPVGTGATEPIESPVRFDELPATMRVRIDTGVQIGVTSPAAASVGSAVAFVEHVTGRRDWPAGDHVTLPDDLDEHLRRAREVL